jgi:hypothetical protein
VILDVPVLPEFAAEAYLQKEKDQSLDLDETFEFEAAVTKNKGKRRSFEFAAPFFPPPGEETHEADSSKERLQSKSNPPVPPGASSIGQSAPKLPLPSVTEGSTPSQAPVQNEVQQPPTAVEGEVLQLSDASPHSGQGQETEAVDPHERILDMVSNSGRMSTLRREAAQSLRTFLFGSISESKKALSPKDIEKVLRDRSGSRTQVNQLYAFWCKMDHDRTGFADMNMFRHFVDTAMRDLTDGTSRVRNCFAAAAFKDAPPQENNSFVIKMIERVSTAVVSKKPTFVIEDMMRVLWPASRMQDLRTMKAWCNEMELTTWRTATPTLLPKQDFDALAAVFKFFDNDQSGSVTLEELLLSGLVDKEQAQKLIQEADGADGDGTLDMIEFCEFFCPAGYRAHSEARIGTDDAGRRLVYDERMHGWRLEEMDPGKAGLFS